MTANAFCAFFSMTFAAHTQELAAALQWEEISFPTLKENKFSVKDDTITITSRHSASLLVAETPESAWDAECLSFEWRVDAPFAATPLDIKGKDDRPISLTAWFGDKEARPSFFKPVPDGALLNLTFGGDLAVGNVVKSPYKEQSILWIARNVNSKTGQWISETIPVRHIAEEQFEQPLGAMKFLAILSDSDDTKTEYHAAVRNIEFAQTCESPNK